MGYPAAFYAALHRGNPGDLDYYRHFCAGATSVLELGCGYGRVLTELAESGRTVVGVEHDHAMLTMARRAVARLPKARQQGVELIEADMQCVPLARQFDRLIVPFGGLYCLLDDHALASTLRWIRQHLAPDGRLAFDVYRADQFHHESEPDDVPADAHVPLTRVTVDGVAYEVLEQSTWDKAHQRIDVSYLYISEAGDTVQGTIAQRYLLETQLRDALTRAGLTVTALTDGFGPDHNDALMVVQAQATRKEGE